MTEGIQKIIEFFKYLLTWWFFVEPWEQAVRVRCGSGLRLFKAGVHFRVPFLDSVYVHNTRRMVCYPSSQTVSSADRHVFVVGMSLSYVILDVMKLHTSVHDPEAVVSQKVNQLVADFVSGRDGADVRPKALQEYVQDGLDVSAYGLSEPVVCVGNFATVRTYRIVQDTLTFWRDNELLLSTFRKK